MKGKSGGGFRERRKRENKRRIRKSELRRERGNQKEVMG